MNDFTTADNIDEKRFDEMMMLRAVSLAKDGRFTTSPNPQVGAVITVGDRIIGEGWHRRFGQAHAEVNAVNSVAVADRELLKQATVYVTLEPCSHYGKTPPCAELLIREGVRRVVVGCPDPNPSVSGRGIAMLRNAGIRVDVGVCRGLCETTAKRFLTAQRAHRPFITLKWACSADGFIDIRRDVAATPAARFSTPLTSLGVMELRAMSDAIMVGSSTVMADNPSLTVRGFDGRSPARVVADRRQRIPAGSRVFNDDGTAVVYLTSGNQREDLPGHVDQIVLAPESTLGEIVKMLRIRYGWISMLVEGGSTLLRSFISEDLWDECRIERTSSTLGEFGSTKAPETPRGKVETHCVDGNSITVVKNRSID